MVDSSTIISPKNSEVPLSTNPDTMTEETKVTMKPEEAIIEIRTIQIKHNQEIKSLQEDLKSVQEKISNRINETNEKMEEEFKAIHNQITWQIASTNNQIEAKLKNIKQEMTTIIEDHIQKSHNESKVTNEQNTIIWTNVLKEIQEIKNGLIEVSEGRRSNEGIQSRGNGDRNNLPSTPNQQLQQGNNSPASLRSNESPRVLSNSSEINVNRPQTVLLPPPAIAPVFHGKSSERPWQFLIRVEEYTETVHMWEEDMLLRGISQFLRDDALEWYCQLRNCHYLPKTWTEFKQIFITQFNSPIRMAQYQQQWNECKQKQEETISEFIVRLRALWVEQFPVETEADLVKHLFCKMRPDILNIMGCPRNTSLQDVLLEAQRVEEILYHRTKDHNHNGQLPIDNMQYSQRPNRRAGQQQMLCYHCGRRNHRARDCWYKNTKNNQYQYNPISYPKNE